LGDFEAYVLRLFFAMRIDDRGVRRTWIADEPALEAPKTKPTRPSGATHHIVLRVSLLSP